MNQSEGPRTRAILPRVQNRNSTKTQAIVHVVTVAPTMFGPTLSRGVSKGIEGRNATSSVEEVVELDSITWGLRREVDVQHDDTSKQLGKINLE